MLFMTHFPDLSRCKRITLAQLKEADEERRLRGVGLLDQLDSMGLVPYQTLPEVDTLDGFLFDPQAIKDGDRDVCLRHRFIFLSKWRNATTGAIALADPRNTEPIEQFLREKVLDRLMDPVIVPADAIEAAIRRVYHPSWIAAPRPTKRPEDAKLLPLLESAAKTYFGALTGLEKDEAVRGMTDLFKEQGHSWSWRVLSGSRDLPCVFCNRRPSSQFYTNIKKAEPLRKGKPEFVCTIGDADAVEPAICHDCVIRDWKRWEADVEAIVAMLRKGNDDQRITADVLAQRFARRKIRSASGECDFCGSLGEGVRGARAFACAKCAAEAKRVFRVAHQAMLKRMDDAKKREEEEKNRPFPDEMREEARRMATILGRRRAKALQLPPEEPNDAAQTTEGGPWDEMRRWLKQDPTSYNFLSDFYDNIFKYPPPPPDVVDTVAASIVTLIESVALNGYRRQHKGMLNDDDAVVSSTWPARVAGRLLYNCRINVVRRARIDEALLLLRKVLDTGVGYYERDDGIYEDITKTYKQLTAELYDYRQPLAVSLREGALLLHGGNAEERLEIARETHLSRLSNWTEDPDTPFAIIGPGPDGPTQLLKDFGKATVYIPQPLALSFEEQAYLEDRLNPTGPPRPTILGVDDEEQFRERALATFQPKLLERLYTFEYDLRREKA